MTVAAPGPAAGTCRLPQIAPVSGLVAFCLGQVPIDAGPGDARTSAISTAGIFLSRSLLATRARKPRSRTADSAARALWTSGSSPGAMTASRAGVPTYSIADIPLPALSSQRGGDTRKGNCPARRPSGGVVRARIFEAGPVQQKCGGGRHRLRGCRARLCARNLCPERMLRFARFSATTQIGRLCRKGVRPRSGGYRADRGMYFIGELRS